ncbi:hypothetical protein G9A89_012689 [Geosiphon pyriformis]|nr:hypothetical protein G9A89_012689 [Geosiphon pyriformis]
MAVDNVLLSFAPPFSVVVNKPIAEFSLSSSKILTTKVSGLESKIVSLGSVGYFNLKEIGYLVFGFDQALEVNSLIAKAVNSSTFVVLGGNFNENGFGKNMSFKFCMDLGLVNSFASYQLKFKIKDADSSKWAKFRDYSSAKLLIIAGKFSDAEFCGKLLSVVGGLPDGKVTGLSGISNKLWKHGSEVMLGCLLVLLNLIALIKTAKKILSKILSNHILLAYSKFNVLQGNNFLVLKSISIQSLVFAIGSVVENALEKNREIWLILQNMQKAYDSVGCYYLKNSLQHVKMCKKFIRFFGSIHENRVNRIITDFSLLNSYKMHNRLDQVKRHEQLCEYKIDSRFISKMGRIENSGGITFYFVGNCQMSTQFVLDIANEFFKINNISINSKKTVKDEAYYYLGIFLSTNDLFKPSIAKTHSDVYFFVNVVLQKAITDKQFFYLVSAVLQPIINVMVKKGLKLKACLFHDFSDVVLHHSFLYDLKSFMQVQSEVKMAALVLGWASLNFLQFFVKLHISLVNNFLAELVKIFLDNELSFANNLSNAFHGSDHFPLLLVLRKSLYFNSVCSLRCFGIAFGNQFFDKKSKVLNWKIFCYWKRLDPHGSIPCWFVSHNMNILGSDEFSVMKNSLHEIWSGFFEVFTDELLKNVGFADVTSGTAVYFLVLDLCIGVSVCGLVFSSMAKLQTVVLFLECVLSFSIAAIDACIAKLSSAMPDFFNLEKNLNMAWVKVKEHLRVSSNIAADLVTDVAACSLFLLLTGVCEHFLVAENTSVSAGPGCDVIPYALIGCVNWAATTKIQLLMAVKKRLYDKCYFSVLCLLCNKIEFSDYAFTYAHDVGVYGKILAKASVHWSVLTSSFILSASAILQILS